MAKYMYGNNGEKWKYLADEEPVLYSGAYRNFVAETPVKNTGVSAGTGRKAVTSISTAALPTSDYSSDEAERQMKIAAINASKNKELKLLGQNYSALINEAKQNNLDNLRQIYIAYMQGCLTYESAKIGITVAVDNILKLDA